MFYEKYGCETCAEGKRLITIETQCCIGLIKYAARNITHEERKSCSKT